MIEVKQLRIGSLVQIVNHTEHVKVLELRQNAARVEYIRPDTGQPHISLIEYRDLQPIELTYEWLEKLCFESAESVDDEGEVDLTMNMWIDPDNDIDVYISLETGEVEVTLYESIVDEEGELGLRGSHTLSFETLAVHQLQNIFSVIKGQELTVKED